MAFKKLKKKIGSKLIPPIAKALKPTATPLASGGKTQEQVTEPKPINAEDRKVMPAFKKTIQGREVTTDEMIRERGRVEAVGLLSKEGRDPATGKLLSQIESEEEQAKKEAQNQIITGIGTQYPADYQGPALNPGTTGRFAEEVSPLNVPLLPFKLMAGAVKDTSVGRSIDVLSNLATYDVGRFLKKTGIWEDNPWSKSMEEAPLDEIEQRVAEEGIDVSSQLGIVISNLANIGSFGVYKKALGATQGATNDPEDSANIAMILIKKERNLITGDAGYIKLYQATGDPEYLDKIRDAKDNINKSSAVFHQLIRFNSMIIGNPTLINSKLEEINDIRVDIDNQLLEAGIVA